MLDNLCMNSVPFMHDVNLYCEVFSRILVLLLNNLIGLNRKSPKFFVFKFFIFINLYPDI